MEAGKLESFVVEEVAKQVVDSLGLDGVQGLIVQKAIINSIKLCKGIYIDNQIKGLDCEWMFGELGMFSEADPFRWSGSITLEKCIEDLEKQKQTENKPIIVKCPSGVGQYKNRFSTCDAAIAFLKEKSGTASGEPEIQQAFELVETVEAIEDCVLGDCEWMYGDLNASADAQNWSGSMPLESLIEELEIAKQKNNGAITVRCKHRFSNCDDAINFVKQKLTGTARCGQQPEDQEDENQKMNKTKGGEAVTPESVPVDSSARSPEKPKVVKRPDCEWMYGDKGFLAHANPLNWSGSITLEACIGALEQQKQKANKPIIVKCPSGVGQNMNNFATCDAAIAFLKEKL